MAAPIPELRSSVNMNGMFGLRAFRVLRRVANPNNREYNTPMIHWARYWIQTRHNETTHLIFGQLEISAVITNTLLKPTTYCGIRQIHAGSAPADFPLRSNDLSQLRCLPHHSRMTRSCRILWQSLRPIQRLLPGP